MQQSETSADLNINQMRSIAEATEVPEGFPAADRRRDIGRSPARHQQARRRPSPPSRMPRRCGRHPWCGGRPSSAEHAGTSALPRRVQPGQPHHRTRDREARGALRGDHLAPAGPAGGHAEPPQPDLGDDFGCGDAVHRQCRRDGAARQGNHLEPAEQPRRCSRNSRSPTPTCSAMRSTATSSASATCSRA